LMNRPRDIRAALESLVIDYPASLIEVQRADIPRMVFNIGLISERLGAGSRVADIGGGIGLFSPACAALGYSSVLVDDFRDSNNIDIAEDVFQRVHRKAGVEIISRDVVADGVSFVAESFDVITTFHSMEHWHHSPKKLFHQLVAALKPGGIFVLCGPNCVNIRKRMTLPFGLGSWSPMSEWYEEDVFRGHVREPSVKDLVYIAQDMGLVDNTVIGRNWLGLKSRYQWVTALAPIVDRPLQAFPSLCSDIYLLGHKP
jgi:SAM-dependent methyltransferase